jgi:hypothetical protein
MSQGAALVLLRYWGSAVAVKKVSVAHMIPSHSLGFRM